MVYIYKFYYWKFCRFYRTQLDWSELKYSSRTLWNHYKVLHRRQVLLVLPLFHLLINLNLKCKTAAKNCCKGNRSKWNGGRNSCFTGLQSDQIQWSSNPFSAWIIQEDWVQSISFTPFLVLFFWKFPKIMLFRGKVVKRCCSCIKLLQTQ